MGGSLWIVRAVASVFLAIIVFVGFGALLASNVSGKLFKAEFYTRIIAEQDTYNRVYDEVLLDPQVRETTREALGDIELVSHEDLVQLVREVFPPEYLQSQVEDLVRRATDYFNKDAETLELYLDLGPPLERARPVLLAYIERRIDEVPVEPLGPPSCSQERLAEVAAHVEAGFREVGQGRLPRSFPSLQSISTDCRALFSQVLFNQLESNSDLDERVRRALLEGAEDIRREVVAGDTHAVLKLVARLLAGLVIDEAVARARQELDAQGRLDLVQKMAEGNEEATEEQLRAQVEEARDRMWRVRTLGRAVALAMVIGGAVFMALVHLPSLKNMLRWPGLTLLLTGGFFFVAGKVLEAQVPGRLELLLRQKLSQNPDVPPSVSELAIDLAASFGRGLTGGFADHALLLILAGAVLFGASFLAATLQRRVSGLR